MKPMSIEEFRKMRGTDRATDPISSEVHLQTSGKMPPEARKMFISAMVDQSTDVMSKVDVIRGMKSDKLQLDVMKLGSRILRKPSAPAAGPADLQVYTPEGRELSCETFISGWDVEVEWLEDNIEGDAGLDTINAEFASVVGNDIVDLAFNGDGTTSGFLACNKGWIKLMKDDSTSVNKVDIPAANVDYEAIFGLMLAALPKKYHPKKALFELWVSVDAEEGYRDQLSARATALGDSAIQSDSPVRYKGMLVVPQAYMPDHVYMLIRPKNLKIGFHRDIKMDIQYIARKTKYEVTISGRADFEFAVAEELVIGYDITP